jgi:hypothetical protein
VAVEGIVRDGRDDADVVVMMGRSPVAG